jgi:hypothetical protein
MNKSFPYRYGPIEHGTIFFYFLEKYLKKFFVLPALPSNEKNSFDHHNSYIEGPNLAYNGLFENPFKSPTTKKVSKNPPTYWNHSNVPRPSKFHIWKSRSFRG